MVQFLFFLKKQSLVFGSAKPPEAILNASNTQPYTIVVVLNYRKCTILTAGVYGLHCNPV